MEQHKRGVNEERMWGTNAPLWRKELEGGDTKKYSSSHTQVWCNWLCEFKYIPNVLIHKIFMGECT